MKNRLLLFLIGSFFLASAAMADPKLEGVTISSGGAINLQGSGYILHDLKGQAVTGVSTSTDGSMKLEIGGIYGLTGETLPPLAPGTGGIVINCKDENGKFLSNISFTVSYSAAAPSTIISTNLGNLLLPNLPGGFYDLEITYPDKGLKALVQHVVVTAGLWTYVSASFVLKAPSSGGGIAITVMQDTTVLANKPFSLNLVGPTPKYDTFNSGPLGLILLDGLKDGSYQIAMASQDNSHGYANAIPVEAGKYTGITIYFTKLPLGTVPLSIARDDKTNTLLVTWDNANYPGPKIFVRTGTYVNDNDAVLPDEWIQITGTNSGVWGFLLPLPKEAGDINFLNPNTDTLVLSKQIGTLPADGGTQQMYFKALKKDVEPGDTDAFTFPPKTNLAAAWAVGKFDVFIDKTLGSIPVSIPLDNGTNSGLNTVIGPQLTPGNYQTSDKIQTWDLNGNLLEGWLEDKGEGKSSWNGNLSNLELGRGYWVSIAPDHPSKTITLVGNVLTQGINISLSAPYTFIGLPYPMAIAPEIAGLTASVLKADNYSSSDKIQSWDSNGQLIENWLSKTGWLNTPILPGKGYWLSHNSPLIKSKNDTWKFQPQATLK